MRRRIAVALAAACLLPLTACGRTGSMPEKKVEQRIMNGFAEKYGSTPDRIDCPGPLVGEVGRTMRCLLADDGTRIGVTLKVTDVEGKRMHFDIKVDDTPLPPGASPDAPS